MHSNIDTDYLLFCLPYHFPTDTSQLPVEAVVNGADWTAPSSLHENNGKFIQYSAYKR